MMGIKAARLFGICTYMLWGVANAHGLQELTETELNQLYNSLNEMNFFVDILDKTHFLKKNHFAKFAIFKFYLRKYGK